MLLPADKARHVGEAVAMVVADTLAQALDAAEAVTVDYEVLPGVYHSEDAMKPGAPLLWDEAPGNIAIDTSFGDHDATERGFAAADHVVAMDFHIDRVTGVTMEPRAALALYDAETGRYTLHAGSGGAVRQKRELVDRPRHPAGQAAGAVVRRRRQLRHPQPRCSSNSAWRCGPPGSSAGR